MQDMLINGFNVFIQSRCLFYAIHSLLYLRTIQEKYIKMFERFVNQLKEYLQAIRILSKRLFTYITFATFKISKNITGR